MPDITLLNGGDNKWKYTKNIYSIIYTQNWILAMMPYLIYKHEFAYASQYAVSAVHINIKI